MAAVRPFRIDIPDAMLRDLQRRLERIRWPDEIEGAGWDYGTELAYLKELAAYWRDGFDWRAQERLLNAMPQFTVEVDGLPIHFAHVKGRGPEPFPLILLHGWPSSFFEFIKIAGALADPAAHGGDPADAFDLVIPSIPGHGFSGAPMRPGMGADKAAALFAHLMAGVLGYRRFGAHGGDRGAFVSTSLGRYHREHVAGIHLNVAVGRLPERPEEMTDEERAWIEKSRRWQRRESGYRIIQGTRPQTLAYGLTDSPAGLAAWIVEKFRAWSDCDGDVERRFTKDELLTNVMIYWVTGTLNASARFYHEHYHHPPAIIRGEWVEAPTAIAVFPKEQVRSPRSMVERQYNLQRWTEMPRGGHFPAFEEPELLVEDVRAFFRGLRG